MPKGTLRWLVGIAKIVSLPELRQRSVQASIGILYIYLYEQDICRCRVAVSRRQRHFSTSFLIPVPCESIVRK